MSRFSKTIVALFILASILLSPAMAQQLPLPTDDVIMRAAPSRISDTQPLSPTSGQSKFNTTFLAVVLLPTILILGGGLLWGGLSRIRPRNHHVQGFSRKSNRKLRRQKRLDGSRR